MIRNFTLSLCLTVCTILASKFSYATIITVTGVSNTNYTLVAGDTLFIAAGANYTGTVSGLNANTRTIIIEGGATFNPASLAPTNGVVCKIKNYGTFTYTQSLTTNTNFTLDNYAGGIINLAAMDTKGRDQVWTNNIGGTINFSGPVLINGGTSSDDNNVFRNYETINANSSFQMNSGSFFTNYKDFNIAGNLTVNGGTLNNQGNLLVSGQTELKNGASSIINYCRMQTAGDILISSGSFTNYTYLWSQNGTITVSGSGTIQNITVAGSFQPPIIHAKNFTQTGGTINGPARLYFWGTTTMSGGIMGVPGSTADSIRMFDSTRTTANIFDVQLGGTRYPNLIYNKWGYPDSLRTYLFGCSVEIFLEIPLAINWKSFEVVLPSNDIPLLMWSAEFEKQTIFEIERSYDGRHFSKIDQVSAIEGKQDYRYYDKSVNTQSRVAYYRINAFELGSDPKYSRIKLVRFDKSVITGLQIIPNPFRSNFNILYNSTEGGNISIRVLNASGQQKLVKRTSVNKGNNIIDISEASQLASGMYILQVVDHQNKVSTGKLIKQ